MFHFKAHISHIFLYLLFCPAQNFPCRQILEIQADIEGFDFKILNTRKKERENGKEKEKITEIYSPQLTMISLELSLWLL